MLSSFVTWVMFMLCLCPDKIGQEPSFHRGPSQSQRCCFMLMVLVFYYWYNTYYTIITLKKKIPYTSCDQKSESGFTELKSSHGQVAFPLENLGDTSFLAFSLFRYLLCFVASALLRWLLKSATLSRKLTLPFLWFLQFPAPTFKDPHGSQWVHNGIPHNVLF